MMRFRLRTLSTHQIFLASVIAGAAIMLWNFRGRPVCAAEEQPFPYMVSALAAAEKVRRTGVPFRFNPMNSRERRVIHMALRGDTAVRSESAGSGPARQVVVYPAGMASLPEPPPGQEPYRSRGPSGPPRDRGRRPARRA